jgi:hypothetical protein
VTYRVAVVQNENELLRYSYADCRHILTESDYSVSYFTAENIGELEQKLPDLNSLVIATNACNDDLIRQWFSGSGDKIMAQITNNNMGLFVLFQMALSDSRSTGHYPFLLNDYEVTGQKLVSGDKSAGEFLSRRHEKHLLMQHPYNIDIRNIQAHCLNNPNVPGLCWGYLKDYSATHYNNLIEYRVPGGEPVTLLVATGETSGSRIVVSSLVLDWQRHDELFTNCVTYVTEGPYPVALLRKRGEDSFEMDLAEHVLRDEKIPIAAHSLVSLDQWDGRSILYGGVLLDPAWPVPDTDKFAVTLTSQADYPPVYFFGRLSSGQTYAANLSPENTYQAIARTAQLWLETQYRQGLWDNSFWATVDVLAFLVQMGIDTGPYRDVVMTQVSKHLQPDGSYDDVFGATCAAINVMSWLNIKDDRYANALKWVQDRLPDQNLYNRATAVDLLTSISPDSIPQVEVQRVRRSILQNPEGWTPGLETIRYMRTLIALGEFDIAQKHAEKLRNAAAGKEEWLTVFGAAETVGILLDIYKRATVVTPSVKKLLFSGLGYILDEYDRKSGSWRGQTAATAKAAYVLSKFARSIDPAVGEALQGLGTRRGRGVNLATLENLRQRSREAVERETGAVRQMGELAETLTMSAARLSVARTAAVSLFGATYLTCMACAALAIDITIGWRSFIAWDKAWLPLAIPLGAVLAILPFYVAINMMDAYGWKPRWLRFLERTMPQLSHVLRGDR